MSSKRDIATIFKMDGNNSEISQTGIASLERSCELVCAKALTLHPLSSNTSEVPLIPLAVVELTDIRSSLCANEPFSELVLGEKCRL